MATGEWTLWGSHPAYADGLPIKISIGTLREVRAARRQRERDGDWLLAIYRWGIEPVGLREQVKAQQATTSAVSIDAVSINSL
jgi:hypothetical protein